MSNPIFGMKINAVYIIRSLRLTSFQQEPGSYFFSQFINKKIKPTLNLIFYCIVSLKRNFTHRIPGRVKIGQIEVPKPGILHLTQQR